MIKKVGKVKLKARQIKLVQHNAALSRRGRVEEVRCVQDVRTGYDTICTFAYVCTCVYTCTCVIVCVSTCVSIYVSICVYLHAYNVCNHATLYL